VRMLVESDDRGKTPKEVEKNIAGTVLRQYSLREIYNPEEAEAHIRGDILIRGLDKPSAYVDILLEPTLLPAPFGGKGADPSYMAPAVRFFERFAARRVILDITDSVINAFIHKDIAPENVIENLLISLASGPEAARSLAGSPVIRMGRAITDERARMLQTIGIEDRAASHFMDKISNTFLKVASRLDRDLALPALHLDMAGHRKPDEDLIAKAVLLEASGVLTISAAQGGWRPLAAITPLLGEIFVTLSNYIKNAFEVTEEEFLGARQPWLQQQFLHGNNTLNCSTEEAVGQKLQSRVF